MYNVRKIIYLAGHTGNWSDEDHLLFLKTRKKCSNIPALVAAIQIKCPDLTAETIVNHEAWYKIYLNLREKQRSTVKEWRKRKEIEKTKKKSGEDEISEGEIAQEKSRIITEKRSIRVASTCETRTVKISDVDDAKKELIRRWRAERENKRSMDEERSKMLTESKRAAQEKRRRERLTKIQEALAEYHTKIKSMEVSSETSKDDPRAGRKYNPTLVKAFR